MTFDDGIIKIYRLDNVSKKGDKPKYVPVYKNSFYFCYETMGLTRYYTALRNNEKIENVIAIYQDRSIKIDDIVEFEDSEQFRIALIQHTADEDGIKISRLSLERFDNERNHKIKDG